MSKIFDCPRCGKKYKVNDELAGKRVKCKICGEKMTVPGLVYEHAPRTKEFEIAIGDSETIEAVTDHIERHIGTIDNVFHEIISDLVHIDVHCVKPTEERPYHYLVTSGMSDRPMTVPKGAENFKFAELLIALPADWPMSEKAFRDEANYWPIRWLKQLARFPHEYETWLATCHTVPNGDPAEPFAPNTKLCCWMLSAPVTLDTEFQELVIDDRKTIHFYALIAIHEAEMKLKLERGAEALFERLDKYNVSEVLDINRRDSCKRRMWPF